MFLRDATLFKWKGYHWVVGNLGLAFTWLVGFDKMEVVIEWIIKVTKIS